MSFRRSSPRDCHGMTPIIIHEAKAPPSSESWAQAIAGQERILGLHVGASATCSSYGGYRLVRGSRMLSITIVAFAMAHSKNQYTQK